MKTWNASESLEKTKLTEWIKLLEYNMGIIVNPVWFSGSD